MTDKKKLAIFDFCGTIFKHQSADMYVDFAAPNSLRNKLIQKICDKIVHHRKYNGLIHKKVKLLKLKGEKQHELRIKAKEFVDKCIMPELITIVAQELDKYIADPEFDVVIASAGYNIYLEYYCNLKNIPFLAATNIEFGNDTASGRMAGYDCLGQEKVKRLKKILNLNEYDLENSVCFSDSLTDKPIFDLVGFKYFVKQKNNDYSIIHIPNEVFTIF